MKRSNTLAACSMGSMGNIERPNKHSLEALIQSGYPQSPFTCHYLWPFISEELHSEKNMIKCVLL